MKSILKRIVMALHNMGLINAKTVHRLFCRFNLWRA